MEVFNIDIIQYISKFLSNDEKKKLREVSKFYNQSINKKCILYHKLDSELLNIYSICLASNQDIVPIFTKNYLIYIHRDLNNYLQYYNHQPRVHNLFRRNQKYPYYKCIVADCGEKKLGTVFISKHNLTRYKTYYEYQNMLFYKRTIPYCLKCFNIWGPAIDKKKHTQTHSLNLHNNLPQFDNL